MKPIFEINKNKKIIKAVNDKNIFGMKLPIKDRKKYVISLHKEDYTDRQIAKELHMSTRDVVKIRKDNEREEKEARENAVRQKEEEEQQRVFASKRAEALQLYKKETSTLDVAIELKISAEEAKEFYQEYCSLLYPHQFIQIFKELNNNINSIKDVVDLSYLIREKGLSIKDGIDATKMIIDISLHKKENQDLCNIIIKRKEVNYFLKIDNDTLKYQNMEMEKSLNSILKEFDIKEKALEVINNKIKQRQEELHKLNSREDSLKAKRKIKLFVDEYLSNKDISLSSTSIIIAIKEDPNKQILIDSLLNSLDGDQSGDTKAILFLEKILNKCTAKLNNEILKTCTDIVLY